MVVGEGMLDASDAHRNCCAHLPHQGAADLAPALDPAEHERARRLSVVAQVHDQGKAELEVLAVARGERRRLGEPAEDGEAAAVVAR